MPKLTNEQLDELMRQVWWCRDWNRNLPEFNLDKVKSVQARKKPAGQPSNWLEQKRGIVT